MSHFTVLVIGDNQEQQLQPFHEFECTGIYDQHIQEIDRTEEAKKSYEDSDKTLSFIEFCKDEYGDRDVIGEANIDRDEIHKYGYILLSDDGKEVVRVVRRTNPNKKWDWYVLGGSWTGFFKVKDGVTDYGTGRPGAMGYPAEEGYADLIRKKDIDIDGMRETAVRKATEQYDKVIAAIGHTPVNEPWSKMGNNMNYSNEARAKYHAQERVQAFKNIEGISPFESVDDYIIDRETYISNARDSAIATFAVIKDGKWYQRGDMGWWGVVSNEKDTWNEEFNKLFDSIPDETEVAIFDCHI